MVNGRLRERDILRHISRNRIPESYLYGQLHFDGLEDEEDRFTSSREGILMDDPKFKDFLGQLDELIVKEVFESWDKMRFEDHKQADDENPRVPKTKRATANLVDQTVNDYIDQFPEAAKRKVDGWVKSIRSRATFNCESYARCFVTENLIRELIRSQNYDLNSTQKKKANKFLQSETRNMQEGNVNIRIRRNNSELDYLDMVDLVEVTGDDSYENSLTRDAKTYRPIRNAVMHTAPITSDASDRVKTLLRNIMGRISNLVGDN